MGIFRILLAISVIIAHGGSIFGFELVGGQLAVQAFYIISGFYMALILNEKYVGQNGSYALFISNRLLRLFPIYWIILLLTILYSAFVYFSTDGNNLALFEMYVKYFNIMSFGSFAYLVFTNVFLILQDTILFLGLNTTTGHLFFTKDFHYTNPLLYKFLFVPQAWTIGIEIAFYIIAPFIVRRSLAFVLLLIALSFGLRCVIYYHFNLMFNPWTYRFFPTELVYFLLGVVAYKGYLKIQTMEIRRSFLVLIWSMMLFVLLAFHVLPLPYKQELFLTGFFISIPFIFLLSKKWTIDHYIGELSYPIYISHFLLLTILTNYGFTKGNSFSIILTLITIVFSILLNELVSKKIERFRQRRINPQP